MLNHAIWGYLFRLYTVVQQQGFHTYSHFSIQPEMVIYFLPFVTLKVWYIWTYSTLMIMKIRLWKCTVNLSFSSHFPKNPIPTICHEIRFLRLLFLRNQKCKYEQKTPLNCFVNRCYIKKYIWLEMLNFTIYFSRN